MPKAQLYMDPCTNCFNAATPTNSNPNALGRLTIGPSYYLTPIISSAVSTPVLHEANPTPYTYGLPAHLAHLAFDPSTYLIVPCPVNFHLSYFQLTVMTLSSLSSPRSFFIYFLSAYSFAAIGDELPVNDL